MKQYEVFKSEGGYRYAGLTQNGNPIMNQSPWFATRKEAEKRAEKARLASSEQLASDLAWLSNEV